MQEAFLTVFYRCAHTWKARNQDLVDVIERFPVAVCDHYHIPRVTRYQGAHFRGSRPSKKRDFYGRKVHWRVTKAGQPGAFFLPHGALRDVEGRQYFGFELPAGAIGYGDKAYNDDTIEDLLHEAAHLQL